MLQPVMSDRRSAPLSLRHWLGQAAEVGVGNRLILNTAQTGPHLQT